MALKIFDDLQDLHRLSQKEKFILLFAGILHDIGVHAEGPKEHHKTALNINLETPILQFDNKTRLIISAICRYHRRALSSKKHDHFNSLSYEERNKVSILSGILRIADGLDYSHRSRIRAIRTSFNNKTIQFDCLVKPLSVKKEISSSDKKGGLFVSLFQTRTDI